MTQPREEKGFGADVIQLLIPHRAPFLMVDRVASYSLGPEIGLRAERYISANEPVFAGHFPGWCMWPGVYTIEGMGQSCMILAVLMGIAEVAAGQGVSHDEVAATLRELDRAYRLRPSRLSGLAERLFEALGEGGAAIGMASGIDVKLLEPVFAGQRLGYRVRRTHKLGHVQRFDVEASVDGVPVARGTMSSAETARPAALRRG